jgi:hypothetical protein
VSDQDFFFDEDEKPEAKTQPKGAPAKKPASPAAKGGRPAPASTAAGAEQSVSYTIAALIGVAALLLGVIIGILLPISVGGTQTATPDTGVTGGAVSAPQLSPEQLNSGQLPPGHPNVGGGSTGATGSATTTP